VTRPTPNRAQLRELAEQVVRHVAAGTGLTTIVTIGVSADGVPVVTIDRFTPQQLDASYERLLTTTADLVREHPSGTPASSCALILPDRDVAYLHPTTPATVCPTCLRWAATRSTCPPLGSRSAAAWPS
jgi:hypothetical protein